MPTLCWLKHLCSIRAWVPVSFFLSLSISLFLADFLELESQLCNPGNISLSPSFTFLSSTPDHQVPVHWRTSTTYYIWCSGFGSGLYQVPTVIYSQHPFRLVHICAFLGNFCCITQSSHKEPHFWANSQISRAVKNRRQSPSASLATPQSCLQEVLHQRWWCTQMMNQ